MVSPYSAITAPQQAGNAPICSGSTTCCATTSPLAFMRAQLASCDSRTMVEKPVRKREFCISCTMPERLAFSTSRSTASMCINSASACRVGKGAGTDVHSSKALRAFAHQTTSTLVYRGSFSKLACDLSHIATPIDRQVAASDIAVEAAIRPVADTSHESVFDWIVVNIVDMALQIGLISDHVLPIASLPNAFITFGGLARRSDIHGRQLARERALDLAPSNRKVA